MKTRKKKTVKISELKSNHFQRECLAPELEAMAREAWGMIKDVGVFAAFEEFESTFLRDMCPERELEVWLWIARQYRDYMSKHPQANKKAILGDFLTYTSTTEENRLAIRKRLGFSDPPL